MPNDTLRFTLVQPDIIWEDKAANLAQYDQLIAGVTEPMEILVLPEMFATGFSMAPERLAEPMEGETVSWMRNTARKYRCIVTGSVIIEEEGHYYNRMVWMQPDGTAYHYDKRHRFAFAGEDEHYTAGEKRVIVSVKGWKICLQVCYDLRFPVWARNQQREYDVLLYVANWPERRSLAWKTLLQARAIENQSYVIGVNRVGDDGKGIHHSGDSSVFGSLGECLWQESQHVAVHTITLSKEELETTRNSFPFLNDADAFSLV